MTTVAAYLRVSTRGQVEDGYGLDVQRSAVEEWANASGVGLLFFSDEGVSGSEPLESRAGLFDALTAIGEGVCSGLVVFKLDRLARDLVIQEQLLAEVARLGGSVFSTSPAESEYLTDDPNDPSRKLIRQILGAVAEYERRMIGLRLKAGRRRKAEQGGFAYGSPSFGYRAEQRQLVPDASEQRTLERIRELRSEGESLRYIALKLTEEGHRPKRSDRWHAETLRRIVAKLDT